MPTSGSLLVCVVTTVALLHVQSLNAAAKCSKTTCVTFLHYNDPHDRTEAADANVGNCAAGPCYGGFARMTTIIRNASMEARSMGCTPILLHGGDEFRGTLWDTFYNGLDAARWGNYIGLQGMVIGNHEFGFGIEGLLNFSKAVQFPLLSANTNFTAFPELQNNVKPYTIVTTNDGVKVGIIGITTSATPRLAIVDPRVTFANEADTANKYIAELNSQGVKVTVLLTHIGFQEDLQLARRLRGAPLILGGHSHTFLANPPFPVLRYDANGEAVTDNAAGPYPANSTDADGKPVLVATSFWGTRYIGSLTTEWCVDSGELVDWEGEQLLVNYSTPVEPAVNSLIEEYAIPVRKAFSDVVGATLVDLVLNRSANKEGNLGNFIIDSFIWGFETQTSLTKTYPNVPYLGMFNTGGIRTDIPAGNTSYGVMRTVLPFGNTGAVLSLTGSDIRELLEGASGLTSRGTMQIGNFRYGRDLTRPWGDRVLNIEVKDPSTNRTMLLTPDMKVFLVTNNFVAGYDSLVAAETPDPDNWLNVMEATTIWRQYWALKTPVSPKIEGRIVDCDNPNSAKESVCLQATSTAG